jgi:hypothetical protein
LYFFFQDDFEGDAGAERMLSSTVCSNGSPSSVIVRDDRLSRLVKESVRDSGFDSSASKV